MNLLSCLQEELTNDTARGPAKGDAQSAKDAYVLGKVCARNPQPWNEYPKPEIP